MPGLDWFLFPLFQKSREWNKAIWGSTWLLRYNGKKVFDFTIKSGHICMQAVHFYPLLCLDQILFLLLFSYLHIAIIATTKDFGSPISPIFWKPQEPYSMWKYDDVDFFVKLYFLLDWFHNWHICKDHPNKTKGNSRWGLLLQYVLVSCSPTRPLQAI